VAAASFAPLVAAPAPDLLGLESLAMLDHVPALDSLHGSVEFTKWRSLRSHDDSRFVGLALPRSLVRLPYDGWVGAAGTCQGESTWKRRGFRYRERVDGPDGGNRLWTSAAWAFAAVVIAEYERSGWFADIRGGSRGVAGGGVVDGLPVEGFGADGGTDCLRGPLDVRLTDDAEAQLADAGFVPLVADSGPGRAVFHSNQSIHRPVRYGSAEATSNARISSMLQYMLCVSRFAHYLKQLGRERMGSVMDADSLRNTLRDWLGAYVTPDDNASATARAQMPLRAAEVDVEEDSGSPGGYRLNIRLQPHFQLDEVVASVRFVTTLKRR
jgi:type VI secretion system protein ImpD